MASINIKELVNACDFKIGTCINKSRYIYKEYNYRLTTYKYSSSYIPPPA
jgi:hypothetical protein